MHDASLVSLNKKLDRLKRIIKDMGSVLVAFSGGADSAFLLKVCKDVLTDKAVAVTAKSPSFPGSELRKAKDLAKKISVRHIIIETDELSIREYRMNPVNRCYYCKTGLFSKLKKIAEQNKLNYVLDGTNYDDIQDFRPGRKAGIEQGVRSPLAEAEFTKKEIRKASKLLNLETWDKPSYACLSSRFPYGTEITKKRLKIIEKSEEIIKSLGIRQLRVRYHNDVARIEILKKDFPLAIKHSEMINSALKKLGFKYVALDLKGYRTGSMNEEING